MSSKRAFHEVRFPESIALGSSGGVERYTHIVKLGSGHEIRNARWRDSRRHYNAGYGIKSLDDLYRVIVFFEERRGKLHGFRWKDPLDHSSTLPSKTITATDQTFATGDSKTTRFQLSKTYSSGSNPYRRTITKPVASSVLIAVDGNTMRLDRDFKIDPTTGIITFQSTSIPATDKTITAGYRFDVPVRFDTDSLEINFASFAAGDIPSIPIIELIG